MCSGLSAHGHTFLWKQVAQAFVKTIFLLQSTQTLKLLTQIMHCTDEEFQILPVNRKKERITSSHDCTVTIYTHFILLIMHNTQSWMLGGAQIVTFDHYL